MLLAITPILQVAASGQANWTNVGGAATFELGVQGSFGFTGQPLIALDSPFSFTPSVPTESGSSNSVELKLGGQITVGPGFALGQNFGRVGVSEAGGIVGLSGDIYPIDLKVSSAHNPSLNLGQDCVEVDASWTRVLSLSERAWIGTSVSLGAEIPLFDASTPDPGSPSYFPTGCDVNPTLSPATASIPAGQSQTYTVEGSDPKGKDLGPVTDATLSISPDGTCTGYACTADVPGPHTVTAATKFAKTTAQLTVTPALLDHMQISPPSSTIPFGTSQAYSVEGFDRFGNDLGAVTQAKLTISPDGACIGNRCTPASVGRHTVTASDTPAAIQPVSATLTVSPLDQLKLTPSSSSIAAGASQTYVVDGIVNNVDVGAISNALLSISPDGSCAAYTCTATMPGPHTVTATGGGAQGTASLTINTTPCMTTIAPAGTSPSNQTVTAPCPVQFTVAEEGSDTIQWEESSDDGMTWTPISGATASSLTLMATSVNESGNEYRAVFNFGLPSVSTSSTVTLTVNP